MGDEMHGLGSDSGNAVAKRIMNSRRLIWGSFPRLRSHFTTSLVGNCAVRHNHGGHVRFGSKADIARDQFDAPGSRHPHVDAATLFLSSPDDHCPIDSAAILCMCDADPLRPVQQQIVAMSS